MEAAVRLERFTLKEPFLEALTPAHTRHRVACSASAPCSESRGNILMRCCHDRLAHTPESTPLRTFVIMKFADKTGHLTTRERQ